MKGKGSTLSDLNLNYSLLETTAIIKRQNHNRIMDATNPEKKIPTMDIEKSEKSAQSSNKASTLTSTSTTAPLPRYYDSEPTSQPPQYPKSRSTTSPSTRNTRPAAHTTGVSAASIAAVCAPLPADWNEKKKRTWSERRRYWKEAGKLDRRDFGSRAELNYYGFEVPWGSGKRK